MHRMPLCLCLLPMSLVMAACGTSPPPEPVVLVRQELVPVKVPPALLVRPPAVPIPGPGASTAEGVAYTLLLQERVWLLEDRLDTIRAWSEGMPAPENPARSTVPTTP